ncbi:tyrosine-type recombinase/integrase [Candidatus Woesearchaeota archaeon]|nr:tyrosine-type recombinase/integrase [Candidatus Woesearchaeota archaeon]
MAENDIYNSEEKYERFKKNLDELMQASPARKYICQNSENLVYFKKLFLRFEAQDISYVRRIRLLQVFKIIVHKTAKNLKDLTREDIDAIVAFVNQQMNAKTASDFKRDTKYLWKAILPDIDERGRTDETVFPYVVRHLKIAVDKSRQTSRKDRFTWQEFEKLLAYFSQKPCIQAYLMFALESLARPQELLWRRIKDVELHDNYAKVHLTSHGKEGVGILQGIDSYAYLTQWLNKHPFKNDPERFLFVNELGEQYNPAALNKHLRIACKKLGISKKITCYSLKRNGVTFRRLRGDSDVEIQHAARWTSTKQLKTYDLSDQEDAFKLELVKRGLVKADASMEHLQPKTRPCLFCHLPNKFTDTVCVQCRRPLDRVKIAELEREREIKALDEFMRIPQIQELFKTVHSLKRKVEKESG